MRSGTCLGEPPFYRIWKLREAVSAKILAPQNFESEKRIPLKMQEKVRDIECLNMLNILTRKTTSSWKPDLQITQVSLHKTKLECITSTQFF